MKQLSNELNYLFDLQLFADESETGQSDDSGDDTKSNTDVKEQKGDSSGEVPKYTDADLDKIISRKMAEITKKAEKESQKKAEAERLVNMTEQEKKDHRLAELEKELEKMKKDSALSAMGRTARSILSDKGIHVSDALVSNLISEDADATKAAVESFAKEFDKAVEEAVAEKLKGNAPKTSKAGKGITKEDIMKVTNSIERQKLIQEHLDLFR